MKLLLVATTALVYVNSLAVAGTLPERQPGSASGLDTNGEFLCNHGFHVATEVSNSYDSGYYYSKWVRAATSIIGKGKSVNEITVEDSPTYSGFQVAIYSSYRGQPKNMMVENDYYSHEGCSRITVPISPITLEKGKRYWVVETALVSYSGVNSFVWLYDDKRSHGALKQSGYSCNYSSKCSGRPFFHHIGHWKPIKGGVPYAKVGESAEAPEGNRPLQPVAAEKSFRAPLNAPTRLGSRRGSVPRYPP